MRIAYTALCTVLVALIPVVSSAAIYGSEECGLSVEFPSTPSVRSVPRKSGEPIEQANYAGTGFFLRAECTTAAPGALDGEKGRTVLRQYARSEGMQDVNFATLESPLGRAEVAKGVRNVNGTPFVLELICWPRPRALFCLTGGTAQVLHPHEAVPAFFQSAALVTSKAAAPGATWTRVSEDFYVSRESIQTDPTRAWVLVNRAPTNGNSAQSYKTQYELDCPGRRTRMVALIAYTGRDASGAPEPQNDVMPMPWESVVPDTRGADMFRYVCSAQRGAGATGAPATRSTSPR